MAAELVLRRDEGPVAVLRPAIDVEAAPARLLAALDEASTAALGDAAVRALVIELEGDPPLLAESLEPAAIVEHARKVQAWLARLRGGGKPVVAALSGRLEAAGCDLALAAHVVVAASGAWLRPGLLSGFGGLQRLARRSGRAACIALSGEPLSAEAARDAGLVDLVAPAGEQLRQACLLAERIASREPAVVECLLEALEAAGEMPHEDALELEAQLAGLAAARAGRA